MLSDSRLVMVWRQVADVEETATVLEDGLGLPRIGKDAYSSMFDAGSYILAIWRQEDFLEERDRTTGRERRLGGFRLAAGGSCGEINFRKFANISNPAMKLTFSAIDKDFGPRVAAAVGSANRVFGVKQGEISFVDPTGNPFSLITSHAAVKDQPAVEAMVRRTTMRSAGRSGDRKAESEAAITAGVGVALTVADPARSRVFYQEQLGLRPAEGDEEGHAFDVGSALLSLVEEPLAGQVRSLRRAGALSTDLLIFHTDNLEGKVDKLMERGVQFPDGIEEWDGGSWARFEDPDGHSLGLWESKSRNPKSGINYFSVLERILTAS